MLRGRMIERDIKNFENNEFKKDNYKFNIIGCNFVNETIQIRNIHNKNMTGYITTIESFFEIKDKFIKSIIIMQLKSLGKKYFKFDDLDDCSFGFIEG